MAVFDPWAGELIIHGDQLKHEMRVDTDNKVTKYEWSPNRPGSYLLAKIVFDDHLRRGYRAFNIMQDGKHGRFLTEFDPRLPEILVVNHFFLTDPPGYVPGWKPEAENLSPDEYLARIEGTSSL